MFGSLRQAMASSASRALISKKLGAEHLRQKQAAEASIKKTLKHHPDRRIDAATQAVCKEYAQDVYGTAVHSPWLEAYTTARGKFIEGWLPQSFYHAELLNYWPDIRRIRARTLASRVLRTDAIPDLMIQYNGHWLTPDGQPIERSSVTERIFAESEEVIVKTDRSKQGQGTTRYDKKTFDIESLPSDDLVIQRYVRAHPTLSALISDNAPTIRVLTAKPKGRLANARSSLMTIGRQGDPIMRPAHASCVLVGKDGRLRSEGFDNQFRTIDRTPETGAVFSEITVPAFEKAIRLCERLHDGCPASPIVGWDLTISENEEPVLFEWNIGTVGMNYHESLEGPLFVGNNWTAKGIKEGLA